MINKEITLEVWGENKIKLFINQGELGSKIIQVTFKDQGTAIDLTGKVVVIYIKKPDGNIIYNNCDVLSDKPGTVMVEITSQISILSGLLICEFHISDLQGKLLKVTGLQIIVLNCDNVNSIIESSSELTILSQYIDIVNGLITKVSDPNFIFDSLGISSGPWEPTFGSRDGVDPTYKEYYKYGVYYVIGKLVHISFQCKIEVTNAGTGYACINGLPFKSIVSGSGGQGLSIIKVEGLLRQGGSAYIPDNSNQIFMRTLSGDVEQSWDIGTAVLSYSGCYVKSDT